MPPKKPVPKPKPIPSAEPRPIPVARLLALLVVSFAAVFGITKYLKQPVAPPVEPPPVTAPAGMVWIPGGSFEMGSKILRVEEPVHTARVAGFFMDETEVTNAQFAEFVAATGYVTTAERKLDWEEMRKTLKPDTPKPSDDKLQPGAMVFTPPATAVPTDNPTRWWTWTTGANWRHPEGPQSNLEGREQHPVVQVSWDDAVAYAKWAGKRLPTETEWEYACRGGMKGTRFPWGEEKPTDTKFMANIWQGKFPHQNTKADGHDRTSPVKTYAPNGFGLYDMAGNVWEWCSDWYRADAYVNFDPAGPAEPWDPHQPLSRKRVTRGGSFLCHEDYCESYRPAARRGTDHDTGMSHIGFRCVKSPPEQK